LRPIGQQLRERLINTAERVLKLTGHKRPLENYPEARQGLELRNPYMDPINMLQVELLRRVRGVPEGGKLDHHVWEAFVVTVNGIAAGMRNTG
jgi:phosphoenolpyruvate carboxylase